MAWGEVQTPAERGQNEALLKIDAISEEDFRRTFEILKDIAAHGGALSACNEAYANTILREGYRRGWGAVDRNGQVMSLATRPQLSRQESPPPSKETQ